MNNSRKSNDNHAKSKTRLTDQLTSGKQKGAPHKFTQNTLLAFDKIINKISVANQSNSLPSNYLSIIKLIHRGRLVCNQGDCFQLTVSECLSNRAILFLDSLARALERSNFKLQSIQENSVQFIAAIKNNEYISFKIYEGYKYQDIARDIKLQSNLERLLYRNKEPVPTGKLTLSISARETNIGKSWTDGVRLIEDEIPAIIMAFDNLVIRQKKLRVDNAAKADQRKEIARIFSENESKYYAEKSIYDSAMQDSKSFTAQKNLEEYLNYLEAQFFKEYGCLNEATLLWFSTARKVADSQSLINKRLKILSTL